MILTVFSVLITLAWIITVVYVLINSARITYLKKVITTTDFTEPSVAIIIPVKDEEAEVEKALDSVCNLDYSNYRIIVVDDRSTDGTPEILKKMAIKYPAVSVITITELPKGWLGKNHALYKGYSSTSEEWILFTDGDILYNPGALKKAIQYAGNQCLDNLTAFPEVTSRSVLFTSVLNTFALMLEIRLRPWNVSIASSDASVGIGAFNLVKRSAYEKAGTHKRISLRPDDDLQLGKLLKKAGFRQDVVYGEKELSLDWYPNLSAFVDGLMKNSFSVANYHLPTAIGMAILTFTAFVLPVPLLFFSGHPAGMMMAATILVSQALLMVFKKGIHGKWWHGLMMPFAGMVMIYIIVKSTYKTLRQGGIYWRDSFYPLSELRKQERT